MSADEQSTVAGPQVKSRGDWKTLAKILGASIALWFIFDWLHKRSQIEAFEASLPDDEPSREA